MLYSGKESFEWNELKEMVNVKKHGISFWEASTVWSDSWSIEVFDPDHSEDEERWLRLGYSSKQRLLVAVFCERHEGKIRIISARKASPQEKRQYHER